MQFTSKQLINKNRELQIDESSPQLTPDLKSDSETYVDNSGETRNRPSQTVTNSFGAVPVPKIYVGEDNGFDLDTILFFERIGCSVLDGFTSEYHLVNSSDVSSNTIQNPNIPQDPKKNTVLSTDKSFTNSSDPFYEISSQKSQSQQLYKVQEKVNRLASSTKQLQADLIDIVITNGSGGSIPRQFNK